MKMNSLDAMLDLLQKLKVPSQLSTYHPKVYNETVNGISAFELGTLPIQHMRDYGKDKRFSDALLRDVASRRNSKEVGNKKIYM